MKQGWRRKTIGDVCDVVNGGTPKTGIDAYWGGDNQWVTPAEMGKRPSPYIAETERKITALGLENSSARLLPPHSVILSTRAPIGHLVINTAPMATNQGCKGLVPRGEVEHKYLYHYLLSIVELLDSLGTGATFKELSGGKLKEVPIPFPTLPEQRRIVGILDEAFDGIATAKANAEKNLANARALFESYLQAVFTQRGEGWVERIFSDVCEISSVLVDPRQPDYQPLLHVGGANIETKTGGLIDLKTAREEGLISGKFLFDSTMVLYSKIRPYLMKVARPDFKGLCSADIYPLSVRPGQLDRDFLFHLLLSPKFTEYAIAGSARAGMPKVNRDHLFAFRVSLPSLGKQRQYASRLDALHEETQRLESLYQRKLSALDELKKSLLHRAFSGVLTATSTPIISAPMTIPNISPTDLHAGILAMAYELHEQHHCTQYFGHVKAEKMAHMVESFIDIDLGREPVKDAAGPNDYPHLKKVEHRARMAGYFDFQQVAGAGYKIKKLNRFDTHIEKTRTALGDKLPAVEALLDLMRPMDTQQAEIFATVYAAWNNLILDGEPVTDERIVLEARDQWHPNKLAIPREKFVAAIGWMKDNGLVPTGKGKRVLAK